MSALPLVWCLRGVAEEECPLEALMDLLGSRLAVAVPLPARGADLQFTSFCNRADNAMARAVGDDLLSSSQETRSTSAPPLCPALSRR